MNSRVYIVDREDQVPWYLDPKSTSFDLDLRDNRREVREWLELMTKEAVVISGRGKMPRPGSTESTAYTVYHHLNRHQFRIYFADDQDAMAFKLAWGGES